MEAAILARQWTKAIQILDMQDPARCGHYYKLIAEHFVSIKDYKQAEVFFNKAGLETEVMGMYLQADQWEQAYHHAQTCMSQEEIKVLYMGKAKELEGCNKIHEAEQLYVLVQEYGKAITMYRKAKQYDAVIRLVSLYHHDVLDNTYVMLAKVSFFLLLFTVVVSAAVVADCATILFVL